MKRLTLLAATGLLAFFVACNGGEEPVADTGTKGSFHLPTETPQEVQEPVLELSYEGGLIKNPDPTPFVRVFPNGRVLIHYPAYMKQAGDYELHLTEEELRELLDSFADREVLTLENESLQVMSAQARVEAGPRERADDHGVATVVKIRAESFTPEGEEEALLLDVDRTLRIEDMPPEELTADPRFRALREVTTGVQKLEALAERPDVEPVEETEEEPQ